MKFKLVFILILITALSKAQVPSTPFIIRRPELSVTSMTLSVSGGQIAYDFRIADGGSTTVECGFIYSYNTKYPNGDNDPNDQVFSTTDTDNDNGVIAGTTSIPFLIASYYFIPFVKNRHSTIYGTRVVLTPNWPTVTLNGRLWLAANLGASRIATSRTDADSYGFKYQWGRASDGHQVPTSSTTTLRPDYNPEHGLFITTNYAAYNNWRVNADANLWVGAGGANNPCPAGWRVPTQSEYEGAVNAVLATTAFNENTAYNTSVLKMPSSQGRDRNSAYVETNNVGHMHWFVGNSNGSANLMFTGSYRFDGGGEAYGGAVRCVQN